MIRAQKWENEIMDFLEPKAIGFKSHRERKPYSPSRQSSSGMLSFDDIPRPLPSRQIVSSACAQLAESS